MSNASDFIIENGVLTKYVGPGGDVIIPEDVTEIGGSAFWHCGDLSDITIPNSVTKIGNCAFESCWRLTTVTIPSGVREIGQYTFRRCGYLQKVICETESLTVGTGVFNECDDLKELIAPPAAFEALWKVLPNEKKQSMALEYLSQGELLAPVQAFIKRKEADYLKAACLQDSVAMVDRLLAFRKKLTLEIFAQYLAAAEDHAQVTAYLLDRRNRLFTAEDVEQRAEDLVEKDLGVKERTMADWKEIFKLSVKDGCVRISSYKKNDTILEIPETIDGKPVAIISDGAFKGCAELKYITIPKTVEEIGCSAFEGCTNLRSVELPDSVKFIWGNAFKGCVALQKVRLPKAIGTIAVNLFDGCVALEEIALPNTVTAIYDYAFRDCKVLGALNMPTSLEFVGLGAFTNCKALTELILPDGVKEIDSYAFRNCTKLAKLRIPANAKKIRPDAFNGCKKLTIHAPTGSRGANLAKANKIPRVEE